jgi:DNA-binding transcriptional ArsR family regulator
MNPDPNIAHAATLVTEPTRAAILVHLLDGRSWTATELAKAAGVGASTASAHLKRLLAGRLITVSPSGRHRYFRLANAEVASLLEQLQRFAPAQTPRSPGELRAASALRECRLCYNHLAGRVGVAITHAMVDKAWLIVEEPSCRLTDLGAIVLSPLGIEATEGRMCMDWSERRLHIAGSLGRELSQSLLDRSVLQRSPNSRALRITPAGADTLRSIFGIERFVAGEPHLGGRRPA